MKKVKGKNKRQIKGGNISKETEKREINKRIK
jgi:hypothetical protein